jgi:hypothetical protein
MLDHPWNSLNGRWGVEDEGGGPYLEEHGPEWAFQVLGEMREDFWGTSACLDGDSNVVQEEVEADSWESAST